ncbi:holo-[acyl-carrier protein] synthase [Acetoanaerobium pronyense]|uniref:Holo-[acyl-carrier-protein] synthase n=1 Tax=Acetoanaerobium pronyense TaxID=1482736 RepID=A0ABS4KKW5_9FIRM|nr:holo-ACP synthase [Acetoanaerobium pronyense]MBP2027975.1 holo-[acyl-carrier protein] synthase [Acetoanaerobium pronyense]
MIIGIGTDIIEINRIEKAISKNSRFLEKLFTDDELLYFKSKKFKTETVAGSFAAKEAIAKALGTGFSKITMKDIAISRNGKGKPEITLYGNAKILANEMNTQNINITISHCKEYAVAFAIIES